MKHIELSNHYHPCLHQLFISSKLPRHCGIEGGGVPHLSLTCPLSSISFLVRHFSLTLYSVILILVHCPIEYALYLCLGCGGHGISDGSV